MDYLTQFENNLETITNQKITDWNQPQSAYSKAMKCLQQKVKE